MTDATYSTQGTNLILLRVLKELADVVTGQDSGLKRSKQLGGVAFRITYNDKTQAYGDNIENTHCQSRSQLGGMVVDREQERETVRESDFN